MVMRRSRFWGVVVCFGLVACAAPGSGVTSPTATAASPTPSPTATASVSDASGGLLWRAVSMDPFAGATLSDVAPFNGGFLAAGTPPVTATTGVTLQAPALWSSPDEVTWQELPASAAFTETRSAWVDTIGGLAQGPSGRVVAVGAANLGDMSAFDAAAWVSTDEGATWARATVAGSADAAMNDVVATADGFVAVGIDGHPSGGTQMIGSRGAAVWTSSDGSSWTRVPGVSSFAGAEMTRVIEGGATLVAVGVDMPTGGAYRTAPIWSSTDGRSWTRASVDGMTALDSEEVDGVVWVGSRFVVVGSQELGPTDLEWMSPDGREWIRSDRTLAAAGAVPADLATVGPTIILAGWTSTGTGGLAPATTVWESTDAVDWQAIPSLPLFADTRPIRVVGSADGLEILGVSDATNASVLWHGAESVESAPAPCRSSDVAMTAGGWGAAMGTTYVSLVLTIRAATPCLLPSQPSLALLDAEGHQVVAVAASGSASLVLHTSATASVGWSSWCGSALARPLTLRLGLLGGDALTTTLPSGFAASCMGVRSTLSLNGLGP